MPLTTLTCPICLSTLKPKTAVAEGTRIRCPKCKGSFVAEAEPRAEHTEPAHETVLAETQEPMPEPAAPVPEEVVEAELDEATEAPPRPRPRPRREDDEDDRPRRRAARRDEDEEYEEERGNRFRRRPKKGGVPVWAWLVGGGVGLVLLLGCCGVGGLVFWSMAGGSGPVSVSHYNQLKRGMSQAEVHNILGPPSVSTPMFAGIQSESWQNGSDFITVNFQNGTAFSRSCNIQHNGFIQMQDSGLLPW